ncbi:hypothetical protein D0Z00_002593 [Geotrichum galactomycetum]|uniref:Uncharacterized protein n=1 Tax=Geotrichum galactomycetum TaxID=27317 RepID=A0ACB6V3R6_9ASCO|nr:hypothetical protein D0Z00_002593 [Geotrichum candidum]
MSFVYFYLAILLFSAALIAAFALLLKLRQHYNTQTWKLDDVVERIACELRTEIADVRGAQADAVLQQRREVESVTAGITRLWSEVYRLRRDATFSAMSEYPSSGLQSDSSYSTGPDSRHSAQPWQPRQRLVPSTKVNHNTNKPFYNGYQSRGYNSGGSGDNNNHRMYNRRVQPASVVPSVPKKTHLLKTEFGTFDVSTSEGRQRWIASITERNEAKGEIEGRLKIESKTNTSSGESADIEESGSSGLPESANIEFLIPKLENRRPVMLAESLASNVETTKNNTVSNDKSVLLVDDTSTTATTTNGGSPLSSFADLPPLTLDEMKAKLEEGVIKGYRRVFIPGRGWVALKKFQKEVEATEKQVL